MFYEYWEKVHISYKEELQLERERMERREEYARNMKKRDSIKMFTLHDSNYRKWANRGYDRKRDRILIL